MVADMTIARLYKSRAWARFRVAIFERDGHMCRDCGAAADTVHHLRPVLEAPELALDADNAVSLCRNCHERTHGRRRPLLDSEDRLAWERRLESY